jgi:branched-subunit amino acid transport protein
MWAAILASAAGCYLLKLLGLSVPVRVLDRPLVRRVADLIPVALLSALVVVEAFSTGQRVTIDARVSGVLAGVVALVLRAPFLVVVAVAAVTTAVLRLLASR